MEIVHISPLAQVDAGKTRLTEPILCETNISKAAERVDSGTSRTRAMESGRASDIACASLQLNMLKTNSSRPSDRARLSLRSSVRCACSISWRGGGADARV
jgi:hypothetical protein